MILHTRDSRRARLVSVIAATVIALACGTNYVYSAWGPQFAQRLKLSSTQSNLIGTFGNLGMYASGIPTGMMVDAKGPRWGVALGIICFAVGYYPIAKAYEAGPGEFSIAIICLCSFFTGTGSASAFTASIKVCALNYPESRGTATAFPLAAFGLSAFFFATVALALPHSTYNFLLLLASGTVVLPAISFFFLRVLPHPSYQSLPQQERQALHRTKSTDSRQQLHTDEPGAHKTVHKRSPSASVQAPKDDDDDNGDEQASLLSRPSSDDLESSKHTESDRNHENAHLDIRGFALLPHPEFWQLFCMLGLLTGIGLMTINNIGNDAQALWRHYDDSVDEHFIETRQTMHVSVLSFGSFTGRLLSGIGSDVLVSKLNRSRFWCLFASALTFCIVQLIATMVEHPNLLFLVSGLTGIAYGMLFGVYPSLVAHTFGVHGLSQNWGTMTLAPVISGNIFNLLYGKIFDGHTIVDDKGNHECLVGLECYRTAYWITFCAAIGGIGLVLWSIWHENQVHKENEKSRRDSCHDRVA